MGLFSCLLIGKELLKLIRQCQKQWGYINGFVRDGVAGAFSADIGGETPALCLASIIVLKNRLVSENYQEKAFYWVLVEKSFINKLNKDFVIDFDTLEPYIPNELAGLISKENHCNLLLINLTNENNITFADIFKHKDKQLIVAGEVQILEEEPSPFERIDGLAPLEEMKEKSVAIVGLGSGGSFTAMELAANGVGTLHLFDKDRLSTENIFRHICDVRDLGRKKVDAVEEVIKEHLLSPKIHKYSENIVSSPDKLREVVQEVDMVICATDNTESRTMANYICVVANKPLILVCSFDSARIGEIIQVSPYKSACYECTRIHLKEQGALIEDNNEERLAPYGSQTKDNSISRGTRTDVLIVAAMAAKIALMALAGDSNHTLGKLPYNYITWGATRITEFPNPYKFDMPFVTLYCNYSIHPKCPICGDLQLELVGIDIEEKYYEIIHKLSSEEVKIAQTKT
ncbi:MAG: HesA/MoeB/ThiF family protein [Bacillota bacterium]